MSFDDLAFPGFGVSSQVRKFCPSCEEHRTVNVQDLVCPSCGERLLLTNAGFGQGGQAPADPMLAQIFQASMASAASNAAASSAGDDASADIDLSSGLSNLFIPSLNNTYADMIRAQQGVNIDQLLTQLLQNDSYSNSTPASRDFIDSLQERKLQHEDFIALYLRVTGVDRDIFPTVALFGSAAEYANKHMEELKEYEAAVKQRKEEEKKSNLDAAASAATATTTATDASSTVTASSSSSSPASATSSIAAADDDDEKPDAPPQQHTLGSLLLANPLSGTPNNTRAFLKQWVVMERGGISFVAKARSVQDAFGRGLIVIQTEPSEKAWPYTMTDTTGAGKDIVIPVMMISKEDGEKVREAIASAGKEAFVRVMTRERPLGCCICREDFAHGSAAVELPCNHHYCLDCIKPWLEKRSCCPLCRFALPTDKPKVKENLLGPESNHAQLQRDMFT